MAETELGVISDFFAHPVVAGIELRGELRLGDLLAIRGHTTDLEFRLESMQIDRNDVDEARAGDSVGIKVPERVRRGDHVYKIAE